MPPHPLDTDLGPSERHGPRTAAVQRLYLDGQIGTVEELERRLELALQRDGPSDQPVPAGWEPVPPCDHEWLDISTFGGPTERLCLRCADRDVD